MIGAKPRRAVRSEFTCPHRDRWRTAGRVALAAIRNSRASCPWSARRQTRCRTCLARRGRC